MLATPLVEGNCTLVPWSPTRHSWLVVWRCTRRIHLKAMIFGYLVLLGGKDEAGNIVLHYDSSVCRALPLEILVSRIWLCIGRKGCSLIAIQPDWTKV